MHVPSLAIGLLATSLAAEQAPIVIDGRFEDWSGISPILIDPLEDVPSGALDIGRVWMADDPDYVYIRFEASAEFDIADGAPLRLLVDTDNQPSTGYRSEGFGAELFFDFDDLEGRFFDSTTTNEQSGTQIWHSDFGFQGQPTVTSPQFELALSRSTSINGVPLFSGSRLRIRFVGDGGERVPNDPQVIEYELDQGTAPPRRDEPLDRESASDVRHLSWNVLNDSPWDDDLRPAFGRVLSAVDADIISLQEIYNHDSEEVRELIEDFVSTGPSGIWHVASNNDCHTVSRYPVLASDSIDGNLAALIDTTEPLGRTTLVINAHLPCCDNDQSRQSEIDRILRFVRQVRAGQYFEYPADCALVITGDMNLVGLSQQLRSLVEGDIVNEDAYGPDVAMDVDGTGMHDVICLQTDARLAYTWRKDWSYYWPGRLDFMIVSDSVLELGRRLVLETDGMPAAKLSEYGLQSTDTFCSDHRPLITDMRVPGCVGDLDGSGVIDGADLSALLGDWGTNSGPADINGDGLVDGADLSIILSAWGSCPRG